MATSSASTGACLGLLGQLLPTKEDVVQLYNDKGIRRMRLYGPNHDTLTALCNIGQKIELMLGVPNDDLEKLAANANNAADEWVTNNVTKFAGVKFRYIVVGNGVSPWNPQTKQYVEFLEPAMRNVYAALPKSNGMAQIKVSTAIDIRPGIGVLNYSIKPSGCSFRTNITPESATYWSIQKFLNLLGEWGSPLLVNIHPYYYLPQNGNNLNYALFKYRAPLVVDGSFEYTNLFDALYDSVYVALLELNCGNIAIVVSETGWPSTGGNEASAENARVYNNKLIQHVKKGTPRKLPAIEAYIYAMFDENLREDVEELERHWGIYEPDMTCKYDVNFN